MVLYNHIPIRGIKCKIMEGSKRADAPSEERRVWQRQWREHRSAHAYVCMYVLRAARFTLPPPPSASLFQAQAVQECAHVQLRTSVDKNTRRHNVSLGTRATVVISLGLYSLARSLARRWKGSERGGTESKKERGEKNKGRRRRNETDGRKGDDV